MTPVAEGNQLERLDTRMVAASSPIAFSRFLLMPQAKERTDGRLVETAPLPVDLWPHQRELLEAAMTDQKIIVLKARQLGVTWAMGILFLWYACTHPGSNGTIVSIGERESKRVLTRIRSLWHSLPAVLKEAWPMVKSTEEQIDIQHSEGVASIFSLPSSGTAGRGETINLLGLDEGAHWEDSSARMSALQPAFADIGQVIIASTANGVGGFFYNTWEHAEELEYTALFAGAGARPDRSEDWIDKKRRELDIQGEEKGIQGLGAQEYPRTPIEAFVSSGHCIFPAETLARYVKNSVVRPSWRGRLVMDGSGVKALPEERTGPWHMWLWPEAGHEYMISGDPCGSGAGRDFAHMVVGDKHSFEQVAMFHGKPDPEEFARQMYRAGWLYRARDGKPALLIPEANGFGAAVLALLHEWKYPNLWASRRIDQSRNEERVHHGWNTTRSSREVMIAALQEGLKHGILGIRDLDAIKEFQRFIANPKRNGRHEAMEGYNDDRVMAWAIFAVIALRERAGATMHDVDLQPFQYTDVEYVA